MILTFLQGPVPLTKRFTLVDQRIDKTPYPMVSSFTSLEERVSTPEDFYAALLAHSSVGHALLKGNLTSPIHNASRAGKCDTTATTEWICLDFDGMNHFATVDEALRALDLDRTTYILQLSASHGIKPGLNAHVFFLLETAASPPLLKLWTKWLNLTSPNIQTELTASDVALRWPLDVTVNQNDKLLYIAPPIFEGFPDPTPPPRIQLIKREHDRLTWRLPEDALNAPAMEKRRINELRQQKGLPSNPLKERRYARLGVFASDSRGVSPATVTGERTARGFVYLNLNGGDSWAYFHPEDNPHVIYNFKGEPNYRTEDLLPDYYDRAKHEADVRRAANNREAHIPQNLNDEPRYFVVNDKHTGAYYKATYDPANNLVELLPAPTMRHVADFCLDHDLPVPESIPDWEIAYDPTSLVPLDPDERRINLYTPTLYRLQSGQPPYPPLAGTVAPYWQLLLHVCGGDKESTDRLFNWLAYIWQVGRKPKTAWVLQGTTGTGKGLLFRVLQQLMGERNVVNCLLANLFENFNTQLKTAQVVFVDEADTEDKEVAKLEPKIKHWITEETIAIRDMHRAAVNTKTYFGLIMASNTYSAFLVPHNDRRFNVAPRQEHKLDAPQSYVDSLFDPDNLHALAKALHHWQVNVEHVFTPLLNGAREDMQQATMSLPTEVLEAMRVGDLDFFTDYIDSSPLPIQSAIDYNRVMRRLLDMLEAGKRDYVPFPRDDLQVIFAHIVGWTQTKGKFTKSLRRLGFRLGRVNVDGATYIGTYLSFQPTEGRLLRLRRLLGVPSSSNVVSIAERRT